MAEKKKSNTDIVIDKVKELLLTKALKPGDILPAENDLATAMNVSRGSVREAMKVLSAFGIVEIKQGAGTFITNSIKEECFNPLIFSLLSESSNLDQVTQLREIIESGVIKLIILHGSDEDIHGIRLIVDDFEQIVESGALRDEDIYQHEAAFHHAMGKATQNPLVVHIYDFLMEFFRPQIQQTTSRLITASGKNTLKIHKRIVQALEERNQAKAKQAIAASLKTWNKFLIS